MIEIIENSALKPEHIPPDTVDWPRFTRFALTLGGYGRPESGYWKDVFENPVDRTLTELRVCLFMVQRMIRWVGDEDLEAILDDRCWSKIHRVLGEIRAKVSKGELA